MRNSKFISLLALFLSFVLLGCEKDSSPPKTEDKVRPLLCQSSSVSDFGIIGGVNLDETSWVSKNAVYLLFHKPDCEGSACGSSCTATLIDRNIVLTAAHCVDHVTKPSQVSIIFSPVPFEEAKRGTLAPLVRKVAEIAIHPDWQVKDAKSDGDIALLRLESVAPVYWTSIGLSKEYLDPSQCIQILAAGYGKTTDYNLDDPEPSRLRGVVLNPLSEETRQKSIDAIRQKVKEADPSIPADQLDAYLGKLYKMGPDREYIYVEQSRNHGVCAGDSGGPAYMKRKSDGRTFVAGVASYVQNAAEPSHLCHSVGAHSSVYFYKTWIGYAFQNIRNQESLKSDLFE